jgi:hypothetical protein
MSITDSTTTMIAGQDVWEAVALVGKIVHVEWTTGQFKVHSVEGPTWFACERDGGTLVDLGLTAASWLSEPLVTLLPMGAELGGGFSQTYPISRVVRGVSLVKGW